MKNTRICLATLALVLSPAVLMAQRKEIQELQRDIALLHDEVRGMNERINQLTVLVEQTLDRVNQTNTTTTVLDSNLKESLREQQREIAVPVANLGAKVDQMSSEFRFVRESVNDVTSRIGKLQTQMDDLKNSMQIMAAPPPPPSGGPSPTAGGQIGGAGPVLGASAEDLFNNARRDQTGGKPDLALAQYEEFLRLQPNSDLAPSAQYYIGEIQFNQGDLEAAVRNFDLVLEKYPENARTADAMFMKARALAQSGDSRSAAREYRSLIAKYPQSGLAQKARDEIARLGL